MTYKRTFVQRRGNAFIDGLGYLHIAPLDYPRGTEAILLHRYVWLKYYGSIPKGYHIHHIDGDRRNNKIQNLAALDTKTHRRLHCGWLHLDDGAWLKPCSRCYIYRPLESYYQRKTHGGESSYSYCRTCFTALSQTSEARDYQQRRRQDESYKESRRQYLKEYQQRPKVKKRERERSRKRGENEAYKKYHREYSKELRRRQKEG